MLANTTRALTEEQREQWAVDGYLQLEGALSPAEVDFFSRQIDRVRTQPGYEPAPGKLPRGHYAWVDHADPNPEAFMDRRDLLTYHQAFIDLIDRPRVFDLILDLMGPYIQFSMSQAIVRASTETFPGYTHTDGGEAQRAIRVTETSRPLAVKVMYLLTDVTEPDSGNFTIFPGSHLGRSPSAPSASPTRTCRARCRCSARPATPTSSRTRSGTGRRPTARARRARPSSTITARCSCGRTISARPTPRCSSAARRASAACWATSAMISAPATSSMRRRTRWR